MGRAQFQHHLLLGAEIERLHMPPFAHIPNVEMVSILTGKQFFRDETVFHHPGRPPLAGDHGVLGDVPPEVIGQRLRGTLFFPRSFDRKGLVVEGKDAAGTVAIGRAERVDIDVIRATVDGVRATVATLFVDLFCFDHLDNARLARVGLGVDDINARRTQPRQQQITPLDMGVGRPGTERHATGIPAKVMEFITGVRHLDPLDNLAIHR